ncbi:hypothetical protein DIPPA_10641 [Diplonema papillatum]|nr:hypothetical protein DIPPA_10641 [Diplonema papillatum]
MDMCVEQPAGLPCQLYEVGPFEPPNAFPLAAALTLHRSLGQLAVEAEQTESTLAYLRQGLSSLEYDVLKCRADKRKSVTELNFALDRLKEGPKHGKAKQATGRSPVRDRDDPKRGSLDSGGSLRPDRVSIDSMMSVSDMDSPRHGQAKPASVVAEGVKVPPLKWMPGRKDRPHQFSDHQRAHHQQQQQQHQHPHHHQLEDSYETSPLYIDSSCTSSPTLYGGASPSHQHYSSDSPASPPVTRRQLNNNNNNSNWNNPSSPVKVLPQPISPAPCPPDGLSPRGKMALDRRLYELERAPSMPSSVAAEILVMQREKALQQAAHTSPRRAMPREELPPQSPRRKTVLKSAGFESPRSQPSVQSLTSSSESGSDAGGDTSSSGAQGEAALPGFKGKQHHDDDILDSTESSLCKNPAGAAAAAARKPRKQGHPTDPRAKPSSRSRGKKPADDNHTATGREGGGFNDVILIVQSPRGSTTTTAVEPEVSPGLLGKGGKKRARGPAANAAAPGQFFSWEDVQETSSASSSSLGRRQSGGDLKTLPLEAHGCGASDLPPSVPASPKGGNNQPAARPQRLRAPSIDFGYDSCDSALMKTEPVAHLLQGAGGGAPASPTGRKPPAAQGASITAQLQQISLATHGAVAPSAAPQHTHPHAAPAAAASGGAAAKADSKHGHSRSFTSSGSLCLLPPPELADDDDNGSKMDLSSVSDGRLLPMVPSMTLDTSKSTSHSLTPEWIGGTLRESTKMKLNKIEEMLRHSAAISQSSDSSQGEGGGSATDASKDGKHGKSSRRRQTSTSPTKTPGSGRRRPNNDATPPPKNGDPKTPEFQANFNSDGKGEAPAAAAASGRKFSASDFFSPEATRILEKHKNRSQAGATTGGSDASAASATATAPTNNGSGPPLADPHGLSASSRRHLLSLAGIGGGRGRRGPGSNNSPAGSYCVSSDNAHTDTLVLSAITSEGGSVDKRLLASSHAGSVDLGGAKAESDPTLLRQHPSGAKQPSTSCLLNSTAGNTALSPERKSSLAFSPDSSAAAHGIPTGTDRDNIATVVSALSATTDSTQSVSKQLFTSLRIEDPQGPHPSVDHAGSQSSKRSVSDPHSTNSPTVAKTQASDGTLKNLLNSPSDQLFPSHSQETVVQATQSNDRLLDSASFGASAPWPAMVCRTESDEIHSTSPRGAPFAALPRDWTSVAINVARSEQTPSPASPPQSARPQPVAVPTAASGVRSSGARGPGNSTAPEAQPDEPEPLKTRRPREGGGGRDPETTRAERPRNNSVADPFSEGPAHSKFDSYTPGADGLRRRTEEAPHSLQSSTDGSTPETGEFSPRTVQHQPKMPAAADVSAANTSHNSLSSSDFCSGAPSAPNPLGSHSSVYAASMSGLRPSDSACLLGAETERKKPMPHIPLGMAVPTLPFMTADGRVLEGVCIAPMERLQQQVRDGVASQTRGGGGTSYSGDLADGRLYSVSSSSVHPEGGSLAAGDRGGQLAALSVPLETTPPTESPIPRVGRPFQLHVPPHTEFRFEEPREAAPGAVLSPRGEAEPQRRNSPSPVPAVTPPTFFKPDPQTGRSQWQSASGMWGLSEGTPPVFTKAGGEPALTWHRQSSLPWRSPTGEAPAGTSRDGCEQEIVASRDLRAVLDCSVSRSPPREHDGPAPSSFSWTGLGLRSRSISPSTSPLPAEPAPENSLRFRERMLVPVFPVLSDPHRPHLQHERENWRMADRGAGRNPSGQPAERGSMPTGIEPSRGGPRNASSKVVFRRSMAPAAASSGGSLLREFPVTRPTHAQHARPAYLRQTTASRQRQQQTDTHMKTIIESVSSTSRRRPSNTSAASRRSYRRSSSPVSSASSTDRAPWKPSSMNSQVVDQRPRSISPVKKVPSFRGGHGVVGCVSFVQCKTKFPRQ